MDFLNSSLDNEALEAQIREAKLKAATFSKSLQEAREQEAIALQALEEEREKWSTTYEKKTILIDQLERELTSTVEALDSERVRTKSAEMLASNLQNSLENERHAHDITRLSSPPRMTRAPEPRHPPVEPKLDNVDAKVWNDMLSQYNQQLRVTTDQLAAVSREKEVLQVQLNNVKKEKEQASLALKDVQGKLDFRMQQVLELEDEKLHFEKRAAALKQQIDTQYIQLSEANIKLSTFQRDSAELTAVKEKNQILERRIGDMIAEDTSARLRQELEEAKRVATSLQIQVKDLERTVDEWVRRTATAEDKLAETQRRLIDATARSSSSISAYVADGVVPAGPSDHHSGSREEWMHRAIVAEKKLEHLEALGSQRVDVSHNGHGLRHGHQPADHGHVDASIKNAMSELAHLEAAHPHTSNNNNSSSSNGAAHTHRYNSSHYHNDDHGHDSHHHNHHSEASQHTQDKHGAHKHVDVDSHHHQEHGYSRHQHSEQRDLDHAHRHHDHDVTDSKSREHSADHRHSHHSSSGGDQKSSVLDPTGLSLNVVSTDASTVPATHHREQSHHHDMPHTAKSSGTLGTVETHSVPSTLRSVSPHPPQHGNGHDAQHHLPPKYPFTSPALVTYTSDVIFDEDHVDPDVDHHTEMSELSVFYGRAPTPLDENWEVVEHSQADYPSVTSDILGHAHDGKHYDMRSKRKHKSSSSGKAAVSAPSTPGAAAGSVRRSTESLMSAKSAKSTGSATNKIANKAATPSSSSKKPSSANSASAVNRNNEITKFRQQDGNVVMVNPKMKDHPAVNTSTVSATSAGFSVLDLVTPSAAAAASAQNSSASVEARRPVTPSTGVKSSKTPGGGISGKVTSSKSVSGNSGVKIVTKPGSTAAAAAATPTSTKGETPRSASAPRSRPSSAVTTPTTKPPLPSQAPARKPALPSSVRSGTPQRASTPSSEKKVLKVVMPTASKTS